MAERKVVARQLFFSCVKDSKHLYLILNDGNFIRDFIAGSEEAAIMFFTGFVEGMQYERKHSEED